MMKNIFTSSLNQRRSNSLFIELPGKVSLSFEFNQFPFSLFLQFSLIFLWRKEAYLVIDRYYDQVYIEVDLYTYYFKVFGN